MTYSREQDGRAIPLFPVRAAEYAQWLQNAPAHHREWLESTGFKAQPGKWCALPGENVRMEACVFGMQEEGWLYQAASLPSQLPVGPYRLVSVWDKDQRIQVSLGWGLASYRFERYKKNKFIF